MLSLEGFLIVKLAWEANFRSLVQGEQRTEKHNICLENAQITAKSPSLRGYLIQASSPGIRYFPDAINHKPPTFPMKIKDLCLLNVEAKESANLISIKGRHNSLALYFKSAKSLSEMGVRFH